MRTYLDCVCNALFYRRKTPFSAGEGPGMRLYIPQLRLLQTYHRYAVGVFSCWFVGSDASDTNHSRPPKIIDGIAPFSFKKKVRDETLPLVVFVQSIAKSRFTPTSTQFRIRTIFKVQHKSDTSGILVHFHTIGIFVA